MKGYLRMLKHTLGDLFTDCNSTKHPFCFYLLDTKRERAMGLFVPNSSKTWIARKLEDYGIMILSMEAYKAHNNGGHTYGILAVIRKAEQVDIEKKRRR